MTTTTADPKEGQPTASKTQSWTRGSRELLYHALVQDRVLQKVYPGIMHFLLFWGFVIQIVGTIIAILQYPLFVPFTITFPQNTAYLGYEFIMDFAGIMILVGGLMAVFRRLVMRPKYLENRWDDWYALILIFTLAILGFCAAGFRIMVTQPEWRTWAPIGNLFAAFFASLNFGEQFHDAIHQTYFWSHIVVGLVFLGSIPFTKLRHMVTGPLKIFLQPDRPTGALEPIENIEEVEKLGAGQVDEFAPILMLDFDACVQCGRCEDVCPSTFSEMPYSPRVLIRDIRDAVHTSMINPNGKNPAAIFDDVMDKEYPWYCTTCGACIEACPLFVNPVDSVYELRRYLTLTTGEIPGAVGEALMGMERRGNPWSMPKENHAPYAKELGVRVLQPGEQVETLLYLGCAFGYDTRSQQAGRELIKILQAGEVDFGILGQAEACCGETARRLGHEYLFQVMAEENITTFGSISFERIVTPCAHCFNTLKNEYPQFGGNYEVIHHTELLSQLLSDSQIKVRESADHHHFTFHDSCYLGRYNQIYEDPRKALRSITNLEIREMERKKENGFCCGGGGGHMWMEIDPDTRINHRRLDEAVNQVQADTIITACPYCLIMFEDAISSKGIGETVRAMDISEVISNNIHPGGGPSTGE
jgi:Fe-S oxidoreductase/nitrate reductase gamma subunit